VAPPTALGLINEIFPSDSAGVIYQNVKPAIFTLCEIYCRPDLVSIHYVSDRCHCHTTRGLNDFLGLGCACGVDLSDYDFGAVSGKSDRYTASDACPSTSYECNLPVQ
jgi:hypothetical protein